MLLDDYSPCMNLVLWCAMKVQVQEPQDKAQVNIATCAHLKLLLLENSQGTELLQHKSIAVLLNHAPVKVQHP